ncbi:MAG: rhamnulokinase [Planctomycetota bacterium]|nr:rhamnulokinase [Planctomycetota bacterium]
MSESSSYLAIDLGAESGRAILGHLESGELKTEEVHRFANEPVLLGDTLTWDFPRLFREIVEGIRRAGERTAGRLAGIAVDSWGVDFGLLDASGDLLANPVHYRDSRTRGMLDEVLALMGREELYQVTGNQFLELNTLVQLVALKKRTPEVLYVAEKMLLVADLVSHFLCGEAVAELTLASTTQLLDAETRQWSHQIYEVFGIPEKILPDIVEAGTVLAPLRRGIAEEAGLEESPPVIACASHDTASAVAAVPVRGRGNWAYISSGTWSLVGVELEEAQLGDEALAHNFTNEVGAFGTVRFLRNVNGLWLLQECRRQWAREGREIDYAELAEIAASAPPARSWIHPNSAQFFDSGDMPRRIQASCEESGQPVPSTRGEILRCAIESLARAYLEVLRAIEQVTDQRIDELHIVGGGSRQHLLNQLTANVLGVPVIAGPSEAAAVGNLLLQAKATGEIADLEQLRSVVASSFELKTYRPREPR